MSTERDNVTDGQCFERMTGASNTAADHSKRLASLEKWRWLQTGALAAIVSLTSFLGTFAALIQFIKHLKP